MSRSDKHLAEALKEYNVKVQECEENGTEEQLLDAYIMRGTVLSMLESYVSAFTDFDEAIDIIDGLKRKGISVDPGTFVKAYVSRGELQYSEDAEGMAEDYGIAASRLKELDENSRYFDWKEIVVMCINCGDDLLYGGFPESVAPFYGTAERMLVDRTDPWSLNRSVDALNIMAKTEQESDRLSASLDYLGRSVNLCRRLMEENVLENEMVLVTALILRGDVRLAKDDIEAALEDYEAVISVLEIMLEYHRPEIRELLIETHRDVSGLYTQTGEVKEAEKHLMKILQLNLCDDLDDSKSV